MTLQEIDEAVAAIEAKKDDDEVAHIMEDDLYKAVLSAIAADLVESPMVAARRALKAKDIEFARWCA